MNGDQLRKLVPKWAASVGLRKAKVALINVGLGFSTAEKLIKGSYESTPTGETVERLQLAMKEYIAELEAS